MKRLLTSVAAVLALSSCGMYTNVPAQVFVSSVKPGSLTFQKPDADNFREITIVSPEVTLRGEPGSIGATFSEMSIQYFATRLSSDGRPVPIDGTKIAKINTFFTVHVPTSNFPSEPGGNPMDVTQAGKMVSVAQVTTPVPLINRQVEDFGKDLGNYADATITAEVIWKGTDDAGFPAELRFQVPISFHGTAGGAGS